MGHRHSDVDEVQKIAISIFVTNFPDQFYAKDLWKVCNQYGNVVDAFIPNRRSKSEVSGWIPDFVEDDEEESDTDDEIRDEELYDESAAHKKDDLNIGQNDIRLEDLFNIYDLLNKKQDNIIRGSSSNNLNYPLRFTPTVATKVQSNAFKKLKMKGDECLQNIHDEKVAYEVKKTCPLSNSKDDKEESICSWHFKKAEVLCSGGSMLQLMDNLVKMNFMSLNIQGLAQKTKKDWVKELCVNKVNFMSFSSFGYSGGILCVWDPRIFHNINSMISDYFVMIKGEWVPNVVIMVEFNEVCKQAERYGSIFNLQGADAFNSFILTAGLEEVPLDMDFPNKPNLDQQVNWENNVTSEEIKRAVWDCGADKSPSPDGFTFGFYRRYWSFLGKDVKEAVFYFFQPITLIGTLYKIIAKILENRLVVVLRDIVNEFQSAFVANRRIPDGPFILNELFHWCKKNKKQTMIFKVDFEKAYDSVRWDYLDDVLKKIGFGDKCGCGASALKARRYGRGLLKEFIVKTVNLTILMGLLEDIYATVDSCETAQEIWLLVQQMMKGSKIGVQEKKANLFNECERIPSNPRNKQIARPGMNMGQDRHIQMVGGNQIVQNAVQNLSVQNVRNWNGLIVVSRIANENANQNGNGNVVAARAEGNGNGNNRNQLLIAQKEETWIHLQAEEFDLMAAVGDLDEIEEVNANCILMANLQQASTSGTQTDKAPVYDLVGSVEVPHYDNCYNIDISSMFTQEELVEQSGGTVEQHHATVEETRALYDSLYNNLAIEVEKVNKVNRKMKETNADLTIELARYKIKKVFRN
ncbi:RNA-directed DNA polymerase, eukaryota, reverse transcriptase zinc-binding domain protein [Tanacetum coccineum]|uniref:RNA-directed DNA polymerase, eukaryota, reverse transcriptase zinc-binding domain protein n=1 Tax=Tanacetum coccineum TaxID=301880 RepID=A0ABQ5C5M3_9ASTR